MSERPRSEVPALEHPPSHSHPVLPARFSLANGPTGEFDEDILERRPTQIHTLDLDRVPAIGEGADHLRDELVPLICLDDHLTFWAKSGLNALKLSQLRHRCRIVRGLHRDDIASDKSLQPFGRVEGDDLPMIDDGDAVAILGLVHVMSRHEHSDSPAVTQPE